MPNGAHPADPMPAGAGGPITGRAATLPPPTGTAPVPPAPGSASPPVGPASINPYSISVLPFNSAATGLGTAPPARPAPAGGPPADPSPAGTPPAGQAPPYQP